MTSSFRPGDSLAFRFPVLTEDACAGLTEQPLIVPARNGRECRAGRAIVAGWALLHAALRHGPVRRQRRPGIPMGASHLTPLHSSRTDRGPFQAIGDECPATGPRGIE